MQSGLVTGRSWQPSKRLAKVVGITGLLLAGSAAAATLGDLVRQLSPNPPTGSQAGNSVSVYNGTAVVGAPVQGKAYVFTYDTGSATWTYQATLSSGVGGDGFGTAVSVTQGRIAVGAPAASGGGNVYIFSGAGSSWSPYSPLTDPAATAGDQFGFSVSLQGQRLVVGAPQTAQSDNLGVGTAYLYSTNGVTWTLNGTFAVPNGRQSATRLAGYSVALEGTKVLMGVPNDSIGSHSQSGSIYPFVCNGSTCTQLTRINPSPLDDAHMGTSVAMNGNVALIGAPGNGQALVYTFAGGVWNAGQVLVGSSADGFGTSVSVSATQALVGAPNASNGGNAYLYAGTGVYTALDTLTGDNTVAGDELGYSVNVNDGLVVAGAPNASNTTTHNGGAYIYGSANNLSVTTITDIQPSYAVNGQTYTVYVTVTAAPGESGTPTGTVAVSDQFDSNATCTIVLDLNGMGSCSMASNWNGQDAHTIIAEYAGDYSIVNPTGFVGSSDQRQYYVYNSTGLLLKFDVQPTDIDAGGQVSATVGLYKDGGATLATDDSTTQVSLKVSTACGLVTIGPVTASSGEAVFNNIGPHFYEVTSGGKYTLEADDTSASPQYGATTSDAFDVLAGVDLIFANGFESCRF